MNYLFFLMFFLISNSAWSAGGYEKQSLWSPQAVGVGGAYSSIVRGADSILYNPANMDKNEIGLNIVTISGYLKSPIKDSSSEKTNDDLIFSGGLAASYKLSERWGLGFGAYGLAGLDTRYDKINYGSVDSSFAQYSKDFYGNLAVMEYSLGASYKVTSKLSFGAALRAQSFNANFGQTSIFRASGLGGFGVTDGTVIAANSAEFKDLTGFEVGSYRLGMNYRENRWGLGLTYRSEVTGELKGKTSGDIIYTPSGAALTAGATAGTVYKMTGPKSTVQGNIPQQVNFDADYDIIPQKFKVLAGYSWTQYSKNEQLKIKGALTNTLNGQTTEIQSLNQRWRDLNDYKLGLMWMSSNNVFSVGGTYSSAVTNKNYTSPNAAPPGAYRHYSGAWSHHFSNKLKFDLAIEYYESSGKGKTEKVTANNTETGGQSGNVSSGVLATFVGMRYGF